VLSFQVIASWLVYKLFDPSQAVIQRVPVQTSELTLVGPETTVVHVFPVVLYANDVDPPATHIVPLFKTALNISYISIIYYIHITILHTDNPINSIA